MFVQVDLVMGGCHRSYIYLMVTGGGVNGSSDAGGGKNLKFELARQQQFVQIPVIINRVTSIKQPIKSADDTTFFFSIHSSVSHELSFYSVVSFSDDFCHHSADLLPFATLNP